MIDLLRSHGGLESNIDKSEEEEEEYEDEGEADGEGASSTRQKTEHQEKETDTQAHSVKGKKSTKNDEESDDATVKKARYGGEKGMKATKSGGNDRDSDGMAPKKAQSAQQGDEDDEESESEPESNIRMKATKRTKNDPVVADRNGVAASKTTTLPKGGRSDRNDGIVKPTIAPKDDESDRNGDEWGRRRAYSDSDSGDSDKDDRQQHRNRGLPQSESGSESECILDSADGVDDDSGMDMRELGGSVRVVRPVRVGKSSSSRMSHRDRDGGVKAGVNVTAGIEDDHHVQMGRADIEDDDHVQRGRVGTHRHSKKPDRLRHVWDNDDSANLGDEDGLRTGTDSGGEDDMSPRMYAHAGPDKGPRYPDTDELHVNRLMEKLSGMCVCVCVCLCVCVCVCVYVSECVCMYVDILTLMNCM
jgi:hypothetical protein